MKKWQPEPTSCEMCGHNDMYGPVYMKGTQGFLSNDPHHMLYVCENCGYAHKCYIIDDAPIPAGAGPVFVVAAVLITFLALAGILFAWTL